MRAKTNSATTNPTRLYAVRTKRVKEARDEAKKEIDEYRKAKEEEFKKFESQVGLSSVPHVPVPNPSLFQALK